MANNASRPLRVLRVLALAAIALCAAAIPNPAKAANTCPWMNEATASGMLGGNAVGEFTAATSGQPAVCTFTQQDNGVTRILRITVEVVPDAHAQFLSMSASCDAEQSPLKAIGNEAMACATDLHKKSASERAFGRVRDQVFTITFATSIKNDPVLTPELLRAHVYTAAEQVAGNLF